jgi:acyl carrier protein
MDELHMEEFENIEVVMAIEDRLRFAIADDREIEDVITLKDLVEHVIRCREKHRGTS